MGLLTNANSGQSNIFGLILDKLILHSRLTSWLLYFCGIGFIFVMPWSEFSHKTYFSENALLPGLVRVDFDLEKEAKSYLDDLKYEAEKNPNPFPWIEARLRQLGLEVYRHNFTLHFPLGRKEQIYKGDNIYAILRAPRASSTEGLVLATPYRSPLSIEAPTQVSLALLLTMAKFFRHQNYWAKDIIFLITQHEQLGMQAWLEAYHQTTCGYGQKAALDHGDLEARAGSLQAAINLEISHEKFTHLNVKVEGLNGQLPNLDLFNLVNRLSLKEGLPPMFQGYEDGFSYWRHFKTFLSMATKLAAGGVPTGNHGLFHRFGIEAVSIESMHRFTKKSRRHEFTFSTAGRICEGIFRSLNNLLERFHQSFFFYLLTSTSRYVSIGMYMPGFGLLAGSLLVRALGLWSQCVAEVNDQMSSEHINPFTSSPPIAKVMQGWILAHLKAILLILFIPRVASNIGEKMDLPTDDSVALGILAFCLFASFLFFNNHQLFGSSWKLVQCIILLEFALVSSSMALCNFSLSYIVTSIFAPILLSISPPREHSKWNLMVKIISVICVHPLSLVLGFSLLDTIRSFPEKSIFGLIESAFSAAKQALMFSITDGYIYGNFTFVAGTLCLLPCWLMVWYISTLRSSSEKLKTE